MEEIFPSYLSKDGLLRYLRVLLNLLFLKAEAMFFTSHSFIICFADFRWKAATNQVIKHSCNFKAEMRGSMSKVWIYVAMSKPCRLHIGLSESWQPCFSNESAVASCILFLINAYKIQMPCQIGECPLCDYVLVLMCVQVCMCAVVHVCTCTGMCVLCTCVCLYVTVRGQCLGVGFLSLLYGTRGLNAGA